MLLALALILAVWLVPFQLTGQPDATVAEIAWNWWPIRAAYVLVAISTLVCTWQRLRRDLRRVRRPLNRPQTPPQTAIELTGMPSAALAERLETHGYSLVRHESGFDAVRHPFSALGGSLFHLALIAIAAAIVLQHSLGSVAEMRVTEGQTFSDAAAASPGWARLAVEGLTLTTIEPDYYKDVLLFTRLDATVSSADGEARKMSLARPRWLDPFTHLTIQDYGLAPHIRSVDTTGTMTDDVVAAMNIFPPGTEDSVTLPGSGLVLSVVAYPDYGVVDGEDVSLSYNIKRPVFRVTAQSSLDKTFVGRGLVGIDQPLPSGSHVVTITGLSRYGTFKLFRSYGPPLALLAGLLLMAGLLLRFAWPRHDVVVWETADGVLVDAWLDGFGRAEGRARLIRLAEGVV